MQPNLKLMLAGALLVIALAFFFFGQSLFDTADAPADLSPTPTAVTGSVLAPY